MITLSNIMKLKWLDKNLDPIDCFVWSPITSMVEIPNWLRGHNTSMRVTKNRQKDLVYTFEEKEYTVPPDGIVCRNKDGVIYTLKIKSFCMKHVSAEFMELLAQNNVIVVDKGEGV